MLEKIFESKNKHKIHIPTLNVKKKMAEKMMDKMNHDQIKNLAKLTFKKLNKDYIDKLSILLYGSKKSTDYALIRNNINKSVLIYNQYTKELDLALPKTFREFDTIKKKNYLFTDTNRNFNFNKNLTENITKNDIKNMTYNKKMKSNSTTKEEVKNTCPLIKDKNNNYMNQRTTIYENLPQLTDLKKSNFSNIKNNKSMDKIFKQNNNSTFVIDKNNKNWKLNSITTPQNRNLELLSESNISSTLNSFYRNKNLANSVKKVNNKKIHKVIFSELYHYDKKKWEKNSAVFLKNMNTSNLKELNGETRNQLNKMITDISKMKNVADKQEEDVKTLIRNNNDFLKKLGIGNQKVRFRRSVDYTDRNKRNIFNLSKDHSKKKMILVSAFKLDI